MFANGQGRLVAAFGVMLLVSQVIQFYLLSGTRERMEMQWRRSISRMDDLRVDLVHSVERAVKLSQADRSTCEAAKQGLKDITDVLSRALPPPSHEPSCAEQSASAVSRALGASTQNGSKCARSYVGMPPPETCKTLKNRHVAIVTIDSLRYDTAKKAKVPWFESFFKSRNHSGWEQRLGHATFSLPAHIVILHGGSFGTRGYLQQHKDPQRLFGFMLNWMTGDWQTMKPPRYIMPEAANLVKAFEKCGYETIGVGGVSWFNDIYETTDLWARDYFQRFVWREHFTPSSDDAFEYQLTEVRHTRAACIFLILHRPSI